VKVVHVSEFGVDDVGNIVATALDQELGRVEESDLEGDLVSVAFREDAGEDVEAGIWGLASGQWAVVVTADSGETRADVTKAVAKTVATTGDRNLGAALAPCLHPAFGGRWREAIAAATIGCATCMSSARPRGWSGPPGAVFAG
jgi:hypothetical protein